MKKLMILASAALVASMGMTGCKEDDGPVLDIPTTPFVLHTPAMADQVYEFREGGNGQSLNDITFTVDQPDYGGVAVMPVYQIEFAKSEADFAEYDRLQAAGEQPAERPARADGDDTAEPGEPAEPVGELVAVLPFTTTSSVITVPGVQVAEAFNAIYGLTASNFSSEPKPVYVRCHVSVPNYPQADSYSNAICLKAVSSYLPLTEAGTIYCVGAPQGCDINSDRIKLNETGIGTNIFVGKFKVEEGKFQFRFYTELGDWEKNSIGSQVNDSPIGITMTDGKYAGVFVQGKGSWQCDDWKGGIIEAVVNFNDNTVTFSEAQPNYLYLIGAPQGWNINSDGMKLEEIEVGGGVYEGTFDIAAGSFQFRFYTALGDWEKNSIGSQVNDAPIAIDMAGGKYEGACVQGKGSWQDGAWAGGKVKINVNTNTMKIVFETVN